MTIDCHLFYTIKSVDFQTTSFTCFCAPLNNKKSRTFYFVNILKVEYSLTLSFGFFIFFYTDNTNASTFVC